MVIITIMIKQILEFLKFGVNMKLEEIGFYTLSDERIRNVSTISPIQRAEILITGRCNFKCPYCRGTKMGDSTISEIGNIIRKLSKNGLINIRFSGGEPTLHSGLETLIKYAKGKGCKHIAISTNGSADLEYYKKLIEHGVNDFSISLDACCAATGDMMAGNINGAWKRVIDNIREISKLTYVTVGIVLTNDNIKELPEIVKFAHDLGVADIRIISAAQQNNIGLFEAASMKINIDTQIIDSHPILKYRIDNIINGRNVRGISPQDSHKCPLVLDDVAIMNNEHYPCIIYMREKGNPIGKVSENMREERMKWYIDHDTHKDTICKNNCLDVCIHHNNKYRELRS